MQIVGQIIALVSSSQWHHDPPNSKTATLSLGISNLQSSTNHTHILQLTTLAFCMILS